MEVWHQLVGFVGRVPPGFWVAAMTANLLITAATWSVARSRIRRAGERAADPSLVAGRRGRDTALTVAALVPAALFLIMVIAGSMHGLVAFGRNVLGWRDGWEYLVPATLDGVSITFAFLAFRAVRRKKAPDRCYRVVWGAAGASASINFTYEYGTSHNIVAGGYVGLLSVLAMAMFHEFLAQFEDGAEQHVRRTNPRFGLRWLTWPSNTFLAAVAWRNHPPADGTPGTVAAAIANLERVRADKRAARQRRHGDRRAVDPTAGRSLINSSDPVVTRTDGPPARSDTPAAPTALDRRPRTVADTNVDATDIRVPTTQATVLSWAQTWVSMCRDEQLWSGPLTDDDRARTLYGRSARQLRRLRQAVLSGALRRQAEQLGMQLPDGFVDTPIAGPTGGSSTDWLGQ